jgi:hypothetical protein
MPVFAALAGGKVAPEGGAAAGGKVALADSKEPLGLPHPPPSDPWAIKYALVPQSKFCAVKPYFTGSTYIVLTFSNPHYCSVFS